MGVIILNKGDHMYIVCLTTKRKSKNLLPNEYEYHSDWQAFETLEEAQEHCNDPKTEGIDWFDGYT